MPPVRLLKGKWFVLAAGLTVSCFLNPQPEPPGGNAGPSAGMGGVYNSAAGGAHYSVGTGGAQSTNTGEHPGVGGWAAMGGATGVASGSGGRSAAADAGGDAGPAELDAGPEPDVEDDDLAE